MGDIFDSKELDFIFVMPAARCGSHPGGQGTAAHGLISAAHISGFSYRVVDTSQPSFPPESSVRRIFTFLRRLLYTLYLIFRHKVKYGAIVFSSGGMGLLEKVCFCLIFRVARIRSVLFLRGEIDARLFRNRLSVGILRYLFKIPNRFFSQGSGGLISLERYGVKASRVTIIPNWLPPTFTIADARSAPNLECPIFIYVGWLVPEKGLNELLEAFERFVSRYRKSKLVLVGDGVLKEFIVSEYSDLINSNSLELTGWLDQDDVQRYLAVSDIFILPSYSEGLPNSLIEALSFGLPAICTNVGNIKDTVHSGINGILVDVRDVDGLYQAMCALCSSDDLYESMSKSAIDSVNVRHNYFLNTKLIFDFFQRGV